jgi:hypothetical protein
VQRIDKLVDWMVDCLAVMMVDTLVDWKEDKSVDKLAKQKVVEKVEHSALMIIGQKAV